MEQTPQRRRQRGIEASKHQTSLYSTFAMVTSNLNTVEKFKGHVVEANLLSLVRNTYGLSLVQGKDSEFSKIQVTIFIYVEKQLTLTDKGNARKAVNLGSTCLKSISCRGYSKLAL